MRVVIAIIFGSALVAIAAIRAPGAETPIDLCGQFASGYNDYQTHQLADAQPALTGAVSGCARLADYALYYLALARRDAGDNAGALQSLNRLLGDYPQSVFGPIATLEVARLNYQLGQYATAELIARGLIDRSPPPDLEESARYIVGSSLAALGNFQAAYSELMTQRERFPGGVLDRRARVAAYALLAAHPGLAGTDALAYRDTEAALLLREGSAAAAREQIEAALELSPPSPIHAELLWMLARAARGNSAAERAALFAYLAFAPRGAQAPAALDRLGHLYWHVNDTHNGRAMFAQVANQFPQSSYAAESLFSMGRAFEDDRQFDSARSAYRRILARYPGSAAAVRARFRMPWTFYMTHRYAEAASAFAAMSPRAHSAADRDMLVYWEARALEKNGHVTAAFTIFRRLARSLDSNYYPALASLKTGLRPSNVAAEDAVITSPPVPQIETPGVQFHLDRVIALRKLGMRELEPPELKALESWTGEYPSLHEFIIGELQAARAWHDALMLAARWVKQGALNPDLAERVRYPLAYTDLVLPAAARNEVEPYLVLALMRQESLFDPHARSSSDARGLMQILPSTALKIAAIDGMDGKPGNLFDPIVNVGLGVKLLRKLLTVYDGDRFRAAAAYNAGEQAVAGWDAMFPGDVDAWVENIQYRETCDYVKRVIGGMREYELLYPQWLPAGSLLKTSRTRSAVH